MSKALLAAVVAVIVVAAVILAGLYVLVLSNSGKAVGFDQTELTLPSTGNAQAVNNSLPKPLTGTMYSYSDLNIYWNITEDIYANYGGALDMAVENNNPGKLYVYAFGLEWVSSGTVYMRNCSVTIDRNDRADLGVLIFGAPSVGNQQYKIVLKVAASNMLGTSWYDAEEVRSSANDAQVKALGLAEDVEVEYNNIYYYNRINERVSYDAALSVANNIKAKYPGAYSVLQIAEAYSWVSANIEYQAETSTDYWQSAAETLQLRGGDCEDHAILISSIIGALGGSARVNIIEEHAFPTVFVASTYTGLMKVKASLASYYGVDVDYYHMSYLTDEHGYWLVIDTTGFPYAGGIPAQSKPTSVSGNWTVLSSYMYCIDATGVKASTGLFYLD